MQEIPQATMCEEQSLRKLFELSRQLVLSLDLNDILQATVEGVATLTGLDSAAVYLLQDEDLRLFNTTPPLPPDFPDELRLAKIKEYPYMCRAIDTSAPVLIPDVLKVSVSPAEESTCKMRNVRTILFLPLIAETEVMGALIAGSTGTVHPVSDSEMDFAHTLANFAALAVKNAKLYQAGQQYVSELEYTIAERKRAEDEREKLRNQLVQSQKMDAIGQLAGGIAHDFNNMLCGIIGNAELLQSAITDEPLRNLVNEIITLGRRSADLIAQLLAFSRKGQNQIILIDLHQIIKEVISILKRTINPNIKIITDLQTAPCITEGDPAQIQSALLNLAVNARDAMPEGGTLSISTQIVNLDITCSQQYTCEPSPGAYIEIAMTDTGIGMNSATLEHIYEPFFTTKKLGEGTGMGLSAVYGTMKSHGGAINVTSKPGEGTTFKLYFPFIKLENRLISKESEDFESETIRSDIAASYHILIIDDEKSVAAITSEHLKNAGYKVTVFNDSLAALSFFKEHYHEISLVILDMMMPQLDGSAVYHSLSSIKPGIKVILVSGYSINGAVRALLNDGAQMFVQKPFYKSRLLKAVNKVLGN
jgi:signal transduction histidine kinase